jgi:hypothetical protein
MKRILITGSYLLALGILLLAQLPIPSGTNGGGGISGPTALTANTIPKATGVNTLGNSSITDNATAVVTAETFQAAKLFSPIHAPIVDATTGIGLTKADGSTVVVNVDTTNRWVQVNAVAPASSTVAGRAYLTVKGVSDMGVLELAQTAADATGVNVGQVAYVDPNITGADKRTGIIAVTTSGATANDRGGSMAFFTKANGGAVNTRLTLDNAGLATFPGTVNSALYQTGTNCSSAAAPAVCAAAAAGSVVVAASATTVVVNTTAVTANSQIFLTYDSSLGTKLGVTCNVTEPALYGVTARTAATSFTITATAPTTNPACFSFFILN